MWTHALVGPTAFLILTQNPGTLPGALLGGTASMGEVRAGDVKGSGLQDLVFVDTSAASVGVLEQTAPRVFAPAIASPSGARPHISFASETSTATGSSTLLLGKARAASFP